jgi:hypothetical protein
MEKDKPKEYKPDAGYFSIGMTKKEIRMLVYWACIGIARSKGGAYQNKMPAFLEYFAKKLKIRLPYKPEFNSKIKLYKRSLKSLKANQ